MTQPMSAKFFAQKVKLSATSLTTLGAAAILSACVQAPKVEQTPTKPAAAAALPATTAAAPKAPTVTPPAGPPGIPTAPGAKPIAGATPPAGTAPAAGATPPTAPVPPNPLRPFADIVKDAKEVKGLVTLWQKEDKVWAELTPEQFNQPMLFAAQRSTGIGERMLYPHWMLSRYLVEFRRFGANNAQVQMVARNFAHKATNNPALQRVTDASFSDSLVGSTGVVSQPHPIRKSVLIDLGPILLTDLPQLGAQTEAMFRIGYGFDPRNSQFGSINATPEQSVIEVKAHYFVPRVPTPNPFAPGGLGLMPSPPRNLADARSFFVTYNYSFAALPTTVMPTRVADDRIGHFVQRGYDFGNETDYKERRYFVNRWRLEKKDPTAAMSEPVKPITYWLDRNIPERYRAAVIEGVLEWNKAFEKIGFKNALRTELEPEKDGPILAATRNASIRWFLDTEPGALAIGPSIMDPRSGEILDADIAISNNWTRLFREVLVERSPNPAGISGALFTGAVAGEKPTPAQTLKHFMSHMNGGADHVCEYGDQAAADLMFSAQLLQMRGVVEPNSPEVERLVNMVLKDVVMHEVGHTLGLRHNFRASTTVPLAKLTDTEWTKTNPISGSVMDYNGLNVPTGNNKYGAYAMTTLGPYDYWAIEYAYRPMNPESEAAELEAIASRSSEPALAYGTDEEAGIGYDPDVNQRDLGNDPLAYSKLRFGQARELWQRTAARQLKPGESYSVLRRASDTAFAQFDQAAELAAKHIGGVRFLRDHSGSPRAPYQPVAPQRQREALQLLVQNVLAPDALKFDPGFVSRLVEDGLDRGFAPPSLPGVYSTVAQLQSRVLARVMNDSVAQRLLEAETKVADRSQVFQLSEVYSTVQNSVWQELANGQDISLQRRTLQRDHLRRLTSLVLRPVGMGPMDTRSLARLQAQDLANKLRQANARSNKLSAEARAHIAESLASVEDSLKAPLVRQGG